MMTEGEERDRLFGELVAVYPSLRRLPRAHDALAAGRAPAPAELNLSRG